MSKAVGPLKCSYLCYQSRRAHGTRDARSTKSFYFDLLRDLVFNLSEHSKSLWLWASQIFLDAPKGEPNISEAKSLTPPSSMALHVKVMWIKQFRWRHLLCSIYTEAMIIWFLHGFTHLYPFVNPFSILSIFIHFSRSFPYKPL